MYKHTSGMMDKNLLENLREANKARQLLWKNSNAIDNPLFRAVELGSEAGEVLGAVQKITRATHEVTGNGNTKITDHVSNLKEELGDVLIVLDLLAQTYGISLVECVPDKFNKTSRKHGINVFMNHFTWEHCTE